MELTRLDVIKPLVRPPVCCPSLSGSLGTDTGEETSYTGELLQHTYICCQLFGYGGPHNNMLMLQCMGLGSEQNQRTCNVS